MKSLHIIFTIIALLLNSQMPFADQQPKLEKQARLSKSHHQSAALDPEQEPNETSAQANPITLPGGRTGSAAVGDATGIVINYSDGATDAIEDLFAVTLTQASRLDLKLTFTTASADLDLFLLNETN